MNHHSYPARCRRTCSVKQIKSTAAGFACGRVIGVSHASGDGIADSNDGAVGAGKLRIADESGVCELDCTPEIRAPVSHGDVVEVRFESGRAAGVRVLAKAAKPPESNADFIRFNEDMKETLRLRARLLDATRRFFAGRGFLEVDTPALVPSPGMELHLFAFNTEYISEDGSRRVELFLPTSPEYHMKRLLAAGFEKIFQICKSFRNGESFHLHNPEFTMLEYYRAYADSAAIMEDLEQLGESLAGVNRTDGVMHGDGVIDFTTPWQRLTVREAFERYGGMDLPAEDCADEFRGSAIDAGVESVKADDSWEDVFYKTFLLKIEPKLGAEKPVFLTEYPASMSALAKRSERDPSVCERFELFAGGMELANGFTELNDPVEQRRRFEEDVRRRRELGMTPHPIDERLLDALETGMPPSGGVAVGFDRLVMLFAGKNCVRDVIAFPFEHDWRGE